MAHNFKLEKAKVQSKSGDSLHVKSSRSGTSIRGYISIIRYQDKDSDQWILYAPSFEISGYGENSDKAFSMLKESIENYFDFLSELSTDSLRAELSRLGWKRNKFRNKDFSRAYVNEEGELKNFNADRVERLTLVA